MNELLRGLVQGIFPAIVVAIVSLIFSSRQQHALERLRSLLTAQCGFFMRKIEAHEKVWPLVAQCQRAQETLSSAKAQRHVDLKPLAKDIAEARKLLKNFVYDNGLYFDDEVRRVVQDLDTQLADPAVTSVKPAMGRLECKLRSVIDGLA